MFKRIKYIKPEKVVAKGRRKMEDYNNQVAFHVPNALESLATTTRFAEGFLSHLTGTNVRIEYQARKEPDVERTTPKHVKQCKIYFKLRQGVDNSSPSSRTK